MKTPDYQSTAFLGLKTSAAPYWQQYTEHEFVTQLGSGALDNKSFIHYLIQDYVFLKHFSRSWGLALAKSETMAEMKTCAQTIDTLVNHEMQLHVRICAENGINESQLFTAQEELENLAYTRYVMDTGLHGDFLDILTALAPCVLGYGEIGHNLAQSVQQNNPYQQWIDTYSGEEYQGFCTEIGQILEQATLNRLGNHYTDNPRWSVLCERFTNATRLEVGFWDMGLRGGSG